jgi:hypothetical protein
MMARGQPDIFFVCFSLSTFSEFTSHLLPTILASQDGYPYSSLSTAGFKEWPNLTRIKEVPLPAKEAYTHPSLQCKIHYEWCLGTVGNGGRKVGAGDVFKRVAFENVDCGDCSTSSSHPYTPHTSDHVSWTNSNISSRFRLGSRRTFQILRPQGQDLLSKILMGKRRGCTDPAGQSPSSASNWRLANRRVFTYECFRRMGGRFERS